MERRRALEGLTSGGGDVPSGYRRVKYLIGYGAINQSYSATWWDITWTDDTVIECYMPVVYAVTSTTKRASEAFDFGVYQQNKSAVYVDYASSSRLIAFIGTDYSSAKQVMAVTKDMNDVTIRFEKNKVTVNGTTITDTRGKYPTSQIAMGLAEYKGVYGEYSFKHGDVEYRHLVPVVRESDGYGFYYDTIGEEVITSVSGHYGYVDMDDTWHNP